MDQPYGAVVPRSWDPSVFVAAPRPDVFAYLTDPVNRPEWQVTLDRVELLDPGPPHVGMRWVDHLKAGPAFRLQIIGMEADELWVEVGTAGPFTAFGTLLFSEETRDGVAGTCVRCVARVRARSLVRPLGWPATLAVAALVRPDLRRAARLIEER